MATKHEKDRIRGLEDQVKEQGWTLENKVLPSLEKIEKTLEENIGGIKMAQLLNSKITSVVLGGIVAAAIYFISKGGGL